MSILMDLISSSSQIREIRQKSARSTGGGLSADRELRSFAIDSPLKRVGVVGRDKKKLDAELFHPTYWRKVNGAGIVLSS
jgi:hypothetical protein